MLSQNNFRVTRGNSKCRIAIDIDEVIADARRLSPVKDSLAVKFVALGAIAVIGVCQ